MLFILLNDLVYYAQCRGIYFSEIMFTLNLTIQNSIPWNQPPTELYFVQNPPPIEMLFRDYVTTHGKYCLK